MFLRRGRLVGVMEKRIHPALYPDASVDFANVWGRGHKG